MNNWLDKLERKFSRYAIPNLMTYIIILYAAGFVLNLINPTFYSQFLSLDAGKILRFFRGRYGESLRLLSSLHLTA